MASDETIMSQNQPLITKLNSTLIAIVKLEFQSDWKNFISELCSDANTSQSKCENALNILKLMSEEVFDFSKNTITASQAK
jgi:exportin-1